MSGPSVYISWPSSFKLVPDPLPSPLPPPIKERTLRAPFGINKDLYNFVLRPEVPVMVAASYIIAVLTLNAYNRRRDYKPWWISRQRFFRYFVVLHNVALALFSFATLAAMWNAIINTWPGWVAEHPAASIADALCKLHGPRGIGDAATYNTTINIWEAKNALIKMGYNGNPDPTDVGRLWNEGLSFWGWVFYVSKFYEVIDTSIILAKGKRSATLQTYHHAGAMLCMWAGIRYMSPPIWMFVFMNSGIHAMMYTYFTLSALGSRVPQSLKRTLTSLQIAQFVLGASYAAIHLFVQYDIPVSTPYQIVSAVEQAVSSASSAASSAVSSFAEMPTASSDWINLAKKLLLRAAGEEGPAEKIGRDRTTSGIASAILPQITSQAPQAPQVEKVVKKIFETRYRTDWTRVNCIDTSGEAFAIYLNLLYLAPLTWLFARFFIKAYLQRAGKPRSASQAARDAAASAKIAQRATRDRVEQAGAKAEKEVSKRESQADAKSRDLAEELRKDVQAVRDGTFGSNTAQRAVKRVSESVGKAEEVGEDVLEQVKKEVKGLVDGNEGTTSSYKTSSNNDQAGSSSSRTFTTTSSSSQNNNSSSSTTNNTALGDDSTSGSDGSKRPLPMPEKRTPPQTKVPQTSPGSGGGGGFGLFRSPGVGDDATVDAVEETSSYTTTAEPISRTTDDPFVDDDDGPQGPNPLPRRMQDAVLETSQTVRPDPEEDSDAMGRSGVNVGGSMVFTTSTSTSSASK